MQKLSIMLRHYPNPKGTDMQRLSAYFWLTFFVYATIAGITIFLIKMLIT
jgi:hypothetical protein